MANKRRVVVTGLGLCSPMGNVEELYQTLEYPKENFVPYNSSLNFEQPIFINQVSHINSEKKGSNGSSRTLQLLQSAIFDLFNESTISKNYLYSLGDRVSLSFSSSLLSVEHILRYKKDPKELTKGLLAQIPRLLSDLKNSMGVQGGIYTNVTACAAGTMAAGIGFDLIKDNQADLVVVGGVDAITDFSIAGFNSMRALSKSKCKPFDTDRDGINIGELAAFLLFEELDHAKSRNATIYGEILGYGMNNDAYHITAPHPDGEGAIRSIKAALNESGINESEIQYVNSHGTGTKSNDYLELNLIKKIFNNSPIVGSTKSFTGHCLGAAGIIELLISCLSLRKGIIPGTENTKELSQIYEDMLIPLESIECDFDYVLSNSFAFGGNTSALVMKKYS